MVCGTARRLAPETEKTSFLACNSFTSSHSNNFHHQICRCIRFTNTKRFLLCLTPVEIISQNSKVSVQISDSLKGDHFPTEKKDKQHQEDLYDTLQTKFLREMVRKKFLRIHH